MGRAAHPHGAGGTVRGLVGYPAVAAVGAVRREPADRPDRPLARARHRVLPHPTAVPPGPAAVAVRRLRPGLGDALCPLHRAAAARRSGQLPRLPSGQRAGPGASLGVRRAGHAALRLGLLAAALRPADQPSLRGRVRRGLLRRASATAAAGGHDHRGLARGGGPGAQHPPPLAGPARLDRRPLRARHGAQPSPAASVSATVCQAVGGRPRAAVHRAHHRRHAAGTGARPGGSESVPGHQRHQRRRVAGGRGSAVDRAGLVRGPRSPSIWSAPRRCGATTT